MIWLGNLLIGAAGLGALVCMGWTALLFWRAKGFPPPHNGVWMLAQVSGWTMLIGAMVRHP